MIYSPIYLGYSIYIVVKHKLKDMMSCKEFWNSKESIVVTSSLVQTFFTNAKCNSVRLQNKARSGREREKEELNCVKKSLV